MWWSFIFLLGIALGMNVDGDEFCKQRGTYQLNIDVNGILKSVKPSTETSDEHVDLSGLGIRGVEKNVFDLLINATTLNLANNSIQQLPEFVFANLTKLEQLSLADNNLTLFQNVFVGLNQLKLLNITNNPLRHLRKHFFFSLTKSTDIITVNNDLWSISAVLFENPFLRDTQHSIKTATDDDEEPKEVMEEVDDTSEDSQSPTLRNNYENANGPLLNESLEIKICLTNDGVVDYVVEMKKYENMTSNCRRAEINYKQRILILKNLGLKQFTRGWYKLGDIPINSIDLTNNEITDITSELLNDLPEVIKYVNLGMNKIKVIRKNVIENKYLKVLNLKDNMITDIDVDALKKTALSGFFAVGNRLKSLAFTTTFPASLTEMIVSQNNIQHIPVNALMKLKDLVYLNIAHNNITQLERESLRGLSSLQVLILTNNKLQHIEPGAFEDLINLRTLYLYRNNIVTIVNGVWRGLENLKDLNLAWNKINKVTQSTFAGLPDTLRDIHVDYNEIELLETASFVRVPKFTLSLDGNKIASIPTGTFNLPHLHELHLKNNSLTTIDGDVFEGLPRLRRLSLNANRIKQIDKGAAKYMSRVHLLDISKNPIEELKNGALFGLPKTKGTFVYVSDTNIKLIQGGLFDDV